MLRFSKSRGPQIEIIYRNQEVSVQHEIRVRRVKSSPYQSLESLEQEKKTLTFITDKQKVKVIYLEAENFNEPADIWITNTHINFTQQKQNINLSSQHLKELQKLKLIVHPNSGFDNFSRHFLEEYKIPVVTGQPLRSDAVSEWYLAELYSYFALKQDYKEWSQSRNWNRKLLSDQRVLLIGRGHVGMKVYRALKQKIKQIITLDPFDCVETIKDDLLKNEFHHHLKDQDELQQYPLKQFDIIILCPSLNKSSYHLIDEDFLNQLSDQFILLNASRGEVIDQEALIKKIKASPHARMSLDVFDTSRKIQDQPITEETSFNQLREIPQIKKTPHIAGVYKNLPNAISEYTKKVIRDFADLNNQDFTNKYKKVLLSQRFTTFNKKSIIF